jgi:hypothetical protein
MKIFSVLALGAFTFVAACAVSSPASDGSVEEGSAQDLTAGKLNLSGSWVRSAGEFGGFGSKGLYLGPNGEFFQDTQAILLGVMTHPPKAERATGSYTIDRSKKTLTLSYPETSDKVTYRYDFTPAHIILGVFTAGSSPPAGSVAKLALTRQVNAEEGSGAATSQIAFPTENYELAPSYCTSDADCDREKADKTWEVLSSGEPHCSLGETAEPKLEANRCTAADE